MQKKQTSVTSLSLCPFLEALLVCVNDIRHHLRDLFFVELERFSWGLVCGFLSSSFRPVSVSLSPEEVSAGAAAKPALLGLGK